MADRKRHIFEDDVETTLEPPLIVLGNSVGTSYYKIAMDHVPLFIVTNALQINRASLQLILIGSSDRILSHELMNF